MRAAISASSSSSCSSPYCGFLSAATVRWAILFHTGGGATGPEERAGRRERWDSECSRGDEGRDVKVSVWWDFENCSVPAGVSVRRVAQRITSALRASGIRGPVTITAFGDTAQLSRSAQEALNATGVGLTHVPRRGKNSADKYLLVDLIYWVAQNPPPAHLFLISGDGDFSNILHRLRMSNYNILLASTETSSPTLYSAASIMWHWNALVRGHTLVGKHFNHPPDGASSSWYGHLKGPLEDPFVVVEQPPSSPLPPEMSQEPAVELKPRPVPKSVVARICNIVNSCPDGMNIQALRSELITKDVVKHKDYFGHKKFTQFLLSLPNLGIRRGIGDLVVYGLHPTPAELGKSNSKSSSEARSDRNGDETKPVAQEEPKVVSPSSVSVAKGMELAQNTCATSVVESEKPTETKASNFSSSICVQDSGESFLHRVGKIFFGRKSNVSGEETDTHINDSSGRNSEKQQSCQRSDSVGSSSSFLVGKGVESSIDSSNLVSRFRRLIFGVQRFWVPGEEKQKYTSAINDITMENQCAVKNVGVADICQTDHPSLSHDVFHNPNFWDDIKLFICSQKGVSLVCEAKSRANMAKMLQKEGPLILSTLKESSLEILLDILISDKKWIVETSTCTFPFKVAVPMENSSSSSTNQGSKGLSSLFSSCMLSYKASSSETHEMRKVMNNGSYSVLQPNNLLELRAWLKDIHENHGRVGVADLRKHFESQFQNKLIPSFYGFATEENLLEACYAYMSNKTRKVVAREKMITDCQDLLDELLKHHPAGFNLGLLKDSFLEKYGYVLDHQIMGYPKLSSMLQVMQGVKVDGSFVFPKREAKVTSNCGQEPIGLSSNDPYEAINLNSEDIDSGESDDDTGAVFGRQCAFEELGPVTEMGAHAERMQSRPCEKTGVELEKLDLLDESSSHSEELTDSEQELSVENDSKESEECTNSGGGDSLMQILDKWYGVQEQAGKHLQPFQTFCILQGGGFYF
ncbi:uncharacterized protein LOC116264751 isoform X2 [Nymphaea colorata]|uniref:uncharacterized protein LOC116264751 isoform X2 n=1 Tax=Nymphaea colorata TaxID=210225 RepID=UPI00129EB9FF|nr:uncharacterized protein LOC116264751 isoform X2 [Nymphaea colorata]